eukprot:m.241994 g.241994  ORF g.241994 m.241994 type:complete len:462 (-) comp33785_c4_seq12:709-2094(-)
MSLSSLSSSEDDESEEESSESLTFVLLTVDSTGFTLSTSSSSSSSVQAFQYHDATPTSNRVCAPCTVCPSGYRTVACTPTTDSVCDRQLSAGDVSSIVLAIAILVVSTFGGVLYGRTQMKEKKLTEGELELTELLLGDVTQANERISEENQRMHQAWTIDEADLQMDKIIGRGAFGTVYSGIWGHIAVAVKVLRIPLDDLDPLMSEDFDREVTFMQSIRHPNLLTFYGAGVNSTSFPFLVTELMEGGSLRKLLLDHQQQLPWHQRLLFAKDIARGMKYLHEKATIHRDLKADNCFVDTNFRVKVADFGTGKIQSQINIANEETDPHTTKSPALVIEHRTLTKGIGSLLWMAPEVLRGEKIAADVGFAVDIYSFGILMWEIWARARPWDNLEGEGIEFSSKLERVVNDGQRPELPLDCVDIDAPVGYAPLMKMCWTTAASERPSFVVTLNHLQNITVDYDVK